MTVELDLNEADTCRLYVTPKLRTAGWETAPHTITEQRTFTDGQITVTKGKGSRGERKRADYILRYAGVAIAVVEAKEYTAPAATGLQQAKDYAEILGLKFAFATNGNEIIEFDYLTGAIRTLTQFPKPSEIWSRLSSAEQLPSKLAAHVLEPMNLEQGKLPRYYQEIAIQRAVQVIAKGQRRVLLTLATGTGKTFVAFQICWKLWNSRWNRTGEHRRPRILFLADREVLVDDPKDITFSPFGDARHKISAENISKSREMYFALYQGLAGAENRAAIFKQYAPDFFDLIVVDECHRGSANEEGSWREILEYFAPAYQLGMTATPKREDNVDSYAYFGNPIYTYSLRQGIEDGFLAPYVVRRVITNIDAAGWRPKSGQVDNHGQLIPDKQYTTENFERDLVIPERTEVIALHLTEFLKQKGRFGKTIVFCVNQAHALDMMLRLTELNQDMVQKYPDYICRITSDEKEIGKGFLGHFKDVEHPTPVIVTTSKLLTTGVDMPTVRNIAICNVINSPTEFKQIIGRGTRVRDDFDKLFFNIIDYTGSATARFADPDFDGYPALQVEVTVDIHGNEVEVTSSNQDEVEEMTPIQPYPAATPDFSDSQVTYTKYYVNDSVHLIMESEQQLDSDGRLGVTSLVDRTGAQVRTLYVDSLAIRNLWKHAGDRTRLLQRLNEQGIDLEHVATVLNQSDADLFDLLCHVAYSTPVRTRKERAQRVRLEETAFFQQFTKPAQEILYRLLDKYADYGVNQLDKPGEVLKLPEFGVYGNVVEISKLFGGAPKLLDTVDKLQELLYAA